MTENNGNNPSVSSVMARFASEGSANGLSLGSKAGADAWLAAVTAAQSATAGQQGASTPPGATAAPEGKTPAGDPLPSDLAQEEVVAALDGGFAPPKSMVEYGIAKMAGPDADIADVAAVSQALHASGVPASFVTEAANIVTRGLAQPMSDNDFDLAVSKVRANLVQRHGPEGATAVAADALAYFDGLAVKHPALADAIDVLVANQWALETAANLFRVAKAKAGGR